MKNIEKILIVVVLLSIIVTVFSFFSHRFIATLWGPKFASQISLSTNLLSFMKMLIMNTVRIVIGIWLFMLARKEQEQKWLWLIFGVSFGLIAVILFYLIKINTRIDRLEKD